MEQLLKQFYMDVGTRETVKGFLISNLEVMAIDAVFNKESVEGIAVAKDLVEKSFNKLAELYEIKKDSIIESSR